MRIPLGVMGICYRREGDAGQAGYRCGTRSGDCAICGESRGDP